MKRIDLVLLKKAIEWYKSQGKKIVWTNGCFDLMHPGHIHSLEKAKEKGDVLIVGLDSDKSIRKLKGPNRPILSEEHRIKMLESQESVDHVIVFEFGEAKEIINEIKPDIYVKSGDYTIDTINQQERKIVESYRGSIYIPPGLTNFSTTEMIKRIKNEGPNMRTGLFKRSEIRFQPLSNRESKSSLEVMVSPESHEFQSENLERVSHIAKEIKKAIKNDRPVILTFGAHLIKNGLSLVLRRMMEEGYVTHLASNGASTIHDWEFAHQGKTEEDVRRYVAEGKFGIWEETCKYHNLAIISGANNGRGYGESIAEMIHKNKIVIPSDIASDAKTKLTDQGFSPGQTVEINHPYSNHSFQEATFSNNVDYTVHPHFGHDIVYTHPLSDGSSIGKAAEIDFLKFTNSVSKLNGGVYLSVGSSIMSPMIFEKSLSMARNVAIQKGSSIKDFMIVVNDIQESGEWDWNSNQDPPKSSPAYYNRFCKTFHRMGAREMHYIQEDNRSFLISLYQELRKLDS